MESLAEKSREDISADAQRYSVVPTGDAEIVRVRFELFQKKTIFLLSGSIVFLLFIFCLTVAFLDFAGWLTLADSKQTWVHDVLKILLGFSAGALWPASTKS